MTDGGAAGWAVPSLTHFLRLAYHCQRQNPNAWAIAQALGFWRWHLGLDGSIADEIETSKSMRWPHLTIR
jgi:hypothetical protein